MGPEDILTLWQVRLARALLFLCWFFQPEGRGNPAGPPLTELSWSVTVHCPCSTAHHLGVAIISCKQPEQAWPRARAWSA